MDHITKDVSTTTTAAAATSTDDDGQPGGGTSAAGVEVPTIAVAPVVLPAAVANLTRSWTESELAEITGEEGRKFFQYNFLCDAIESIVDYKNAIFFAVLAVYKRKLEQFRVETETAIALFRFEVEELRRQFERLKRFRRSLITERTNDWRLDGRRGAAAAAGGGSGEGVSAAANENGGVTSSATSSKRKRWGKRSSIRRRHR